MNNGKHGKGALPEETGTAAEAWKRALSEGIDEARRDEEIPADETPPDAPSKRNLRDPYAYPSHDAEIKARLAREARKNQQEYNETISVLPDVPTLSLRKNSMSENQKPGPTEHPTDPEKEPSTPTTLDENNETPRSDGKNTKTAESHPASFDTSNINARTEEAHAKIARMADAARAEAAGHINAAEKETGATSEKTEYITEQRLREHAEELQRRLDNASPEDRPALTKQIENVRAARARFKDEYSGTMNREFNAELPPNLNQALKSVDKKTDKKWQGFLEKSAAVGQKMKEWITGYEKLPVRYKIALGGTFLAAGFLSGGGIVGAVAGFGLGVQRALGAAVVFMAAERMLKSRYEKKHGERTQGVARRHTVEAAVLGTLVGSGVAGQAFANMLDMFGGAGTAELMGETKTEAAASSIPDGGGELPTQEELTGEAASTPPGAESAPRPGGTSAAETSANKTPSINAEVEDAPLGNTDQTYANVENAAFESQQAHAPAATPEPTAASTETIDQAEQYNEAAWRGDHLVTIEKGGTLWGAIESKLEAGGHFAGMEEGQKAHLIDAIKDQFAKMSPEELKNIGIESGDINKLAAGDKIDLRPVFAKEGLLEKTLTDAGFLSDAQAQAIESNNAKIAEWAKAHPNEALTGERINDILSGKAEAPDTAYSPAPGETYTVSPGEGVAQGGAGAESTPSPASEYYSQQAGRAVNIAESMNLDTSQKLTLTTQGGVPISINGQTIPDAALTPEELALKNAGDYVNAQSQVITIEGGAATPQSAPQPGGSNVWINPDTGKSMPVGGVEQVASAGQEAANDAGSAASQELPAATEALIEKQTLGDVDAILGDSRIPGAPPSGGVGTRLWGALKDMNMEDFAALSVGGEELSIPLSADEVAKVDRMARYVAELTKATGVVPDPSQTLFDFLKEANTADVLTNTLKAA